MWGTEVTPDYNLRTCTTGNGKRLFQARGTASAPLGTRAVVKRSASPPQLARRRPDAALPAPGPRPRVPPQHDTEQSR